MASTRPSARPLKEREGLYRIRLVSGSGLPVNVWVIKHGRRATLIDSGFTSTADELLRQLALLEIGPADVESVLLTHTHEDHVGGVVALADRWDAQVFCRADSVPLQSNWYEHYEAMPRWGDWVASFLPDGSLRDRLVELRSRRPKVSIRQGGSGEIPRRREVRIGEAFEAGGIRWRTVDAAGHDPWHVAWAADDLGWMATGDVLLGIPTPIMPPMNDELATFRRTLVRWQTDEAPTFCLPGHGRSLVDFGDECARSFAWLRVLWDTVTEALASGEWFDPGPLSLSLPGGDDPRRMFVWLGNLHSQLLELEAMDVAERSPESRLWRGKGRAVTFAERLRLDADEA